MNLAKKFVEETPQRGSWMFYLWGHSYEFEEKDNWNILEEFAAFVGGHDDIWYATNIQIYDYVQAFGRLEFSADGNRIYNPTATELYFHKPGSSAPADCILPGAYFEF